MAEDLLGLVGVGARQQHARAAPIAPLPQVLARRHHVALAADRLGLEDDAAAGVEQTPAEIQILAALRTSAVEALVETAEAKEHVPANRHLTCEQVFDPELAFLLAQPRRAAFRPP